MPDNSGGDADQLKHLAQRQEQLERQLERMRSNHADLEQRLNIVENSIVFRTLRGIGRMWSDMRGKAGQALLRSPRLHDAYVRVSGAAETEADAYTAWIEAVEAQLPSWEAHRDTSSGWLYRPLISVVMAAYQPNADWIRAAIDSVLKQSYAHWQLGICLDGADPAAEALLREYADADSRITFTVLRERRGISEALNTAGQLGSGEFVAFLDHDDVLSPYALHYVVESIKESAADLIYTDEDSLENDRRVRPNFKPGVSPELLSSCMYLGHLLVVRRQLLDDMYWFRSEYDGAQDFDVAVRLYEAGCTFRHVPRVLYHWRVHPESTAASAAAKPYAQQAGRQVLLAAMKRRGSPVEAIDDGPIPHTYIVKRAIPASVGFSVIICTRNSGLLERCLESLKTTASSLIHECIVVHHTLVPVDPRVDQVAANYECTIERYPETFNFAVMNTRAAERASSPYLLFLNDDVVALKPGWAEALIAQISRAEIGIAGAKLIYGSGAIQHAGIVLGAGQGTGHVGRGAFASSLWRWLELTRDVSAVTGACMAIRRSVFDELGGFDDDFPVNFNDVDLCLKAQTAGYRVVLEAAAVLRHDECRTRVPGTSADERDLLYERWESRLRAGDPFYSQWLAPTEAIALNPNVAQR